MKNKPSLFLPIASLILSAIYFSSCDPSSISYEQPILGARNAPVIEVDGYSFKDLNKNGELDPYEDWRLSPAQRSEDLLEKMSLEEKVGFMLISTTRMGNDFSFQRGGGSGLPITSEFNEEDLVQETNMFTREQLPTPMMSAAGTTKGVKEFHLRHFILRANTKARVIAEWANNLQALCESTTLGIPAIISSNPRNHITNDAALGTSVGLTDFSKWPGELGLSAMRDLSLTREFADIARQEWASVGLRKGYMYMADLSTEPRWQRIDGTFGENAEWVAEMTREVVRGFQGKELGSGSVALTTKHFPGGGAGKGGQDPHFPWGKQAVYPGRMFDYHLIPFKAAIEAGTSSIMPYYSMPVGTEYEEVAFAYNKGVIQDLLRGELGFEGIINSDTGPIEMMPWGVEELEIQERYKRALEAGVNLFSGTADPAQLLNTVQSGKVDMQFIDQSVKRLLEEKFKLGLFENPYVDPDYADEIAGKSSFQEKADLAIRKSIVLLRNDDGVLPLKENTKIYFEVYQKSVENPTGPGEILTELSEEYPFTFVSNVEEADFSLVWVFPRGKSLFQSDGGDLEIHLSASGVNPEYLKGLAKKKPMILALNYSSPWVIDELYNDQTSSTIPGVLATFGATPEALLDIISGKFNPSGKMPFTTPISKQAVANQREDVPGYLEGDDYALFQFDEGLSY